MTGDAQAAPESLSPLERRLPPIIEVGAGALVLCIAGVIYLTSYGERAPALGPAIGLVIAAFVVVLANAAVLSRIPDFNWRAFWTVGMWTLVAYSVIAGMLMYTFIYDQLPTGQLSLLVATLAVFAVDIPMMLAFSVARFQPRATEPRL